MIKYEKKHVKDNKIFIKYTKIKDKKKKKDWERCLNFDKEVKKRYQYYLERKKRLPNYLKHKGSY